MAWLTQTLARAQLERETVKFLVLSVGGINFGKATSLFQVKLLSQSESMRTKKIPPSRKLLTDREVELGGSFKTKKALTMYTSNISTLVGADASQLSRPSRRRSFSPMRGYSCAWGFRRGPKVPLHQCSGFLRFFNRTQGSRSGGVESLNARVRAASTLHRVWVGRAGLARVPQFLSGVLSGSAADSNAWNGGGSVPYPREGCCVTLDHLCVNRSYIP